MSPLTLGDFAHGAEALDAAAKGGGGGNYGFAPQISWQQGEEKYVLFLLGIEEAPVVRIHEWIDCGTKDNGKTDWGFFLDRTEEVIGEDHDPLTAKGSKPRKRVVTAAVELEPIMGETGRGRKRPTGFRVLTSTYDRKTDDGTEEVTQPAVGYISQSYGNFFAQLRSHDEAGEYEGVVFRIKRVDDKNYTFTPYVDMDVDLSDLIEYIEGVSYLSRNEEVWDELEAALAEAEDDEEAAHLIGVALLERRLNELADADLYHEKTDHIEKIVDRFDKSGNNDRGAKRERGERPSQRNRSRNSSDDEPAEDKGDRSAAKNLKFQKIKEMAAKG